MTPIHTLCLFVSGYIASRLLVGVGAHELVVSRLLRNARGRPEKLLLALMVGCAALSLLLPNAVTVLAMIPILELLIHRGPCNKNLEPPPPLSPGAVTALGLAVIYGANIGGTGSLVGSPANLYLLFSLEVLDIPGRSSIHFVSWLLFGIPLMALLLLPAWGLLVAFTPSKALQEIASLVPPRTQKKERVSSRGGVVVLGVTLLTHLLLLGVRPFWAPSPLWQVRILHRSYPIGLFDLLALGVTLSTTAGALTVRGGPKAGPRTRLLSPENLAGNLPWRGVVMVGIALTVVSLVAVLGGKDALQFVSQQLSTLGGGAVVMTFSLVLICLFGTEVLSNTTTATLLFPAAAVMSEGIGIPPLPTVIALSLASTCAFMTPMATPVNALAFGTFKGMRLRTMMAAGALVNLTTGLLITLWAHTVIPWVLRLF